MDLTGRDYATHCWDAHLRRLIMVLELAGGAEDPRAAEETAEFNIEDVLPSPSLAMGDSPLIEVTLRREANNRLVPPHAQARQYGRETVGRWRAVGRQVPKHYRRRTARAARADDSRSRPG